MAALMLSRRHLLGLAPATALALTTSSAYAGQATPTPWPATGLVALTFDAGADRGYAEDILDYLRDQQLVATFGVTGQWAETSPDLVQRMAGEGHMVINHTYDHRSFTGASDKLGGLSADSRRAELEQAEAVLSPLIGHSPQPWWRLPYGDDDARVDADVAPTGYTVKVGWTVDSLGWRGLAAPDIVARCVRLATPNGVYIMHVGRESQDNLALSGVVDALREQGYGFVSVATLLAPDAA
jgi:peptidoglycan/xylan/chitin deacetylase (PgdA/CDA1 family)